MNRFDANRDLENVAEEEAVDQGQQMEQMARVIRQQEEALNQMRLQFANQIQQQPLLTPKELLQQFRQLKCLDEGHNVMAFIKSVEAIINLCPQNNIQLMNLAMTIVANEKILGDAGRHIQELGDNPTWAEMKAKLMQQGKPRVTYGDIFNRCRDTKVSNLRELFDQFQRAKFQINEIYLFDEDKPEIYKPDRVDKDLVSLLIEKIDVPMRSHLDENCSLNNIINKYSKIKALDDTRAIHIKHRKIVNNYNKNFNINNTTTKFKPNTSMHLQKNQNTQSVNTYKNQQYSNINKNTIRNSATAQIHPNTNTYNQNRQYYQNHVPNYERENRTNQTRITNMSTNSRNIAPSYEPMEIGTLEENQLEAENEINFLISPHEQDYQ